MNPRRGRESLGHLNAKIKVAHKMSGPMWSVFIEQHNADIVLFYHRSGFVAGIEIESSARHVLRNIERDFINGCHAVAVVSLEQQYHNQISAKVQQFISLHPHHWVKLFPYNRSGLQELYAEIAEMARQHISTAFHFQTTINHKENNP